MHHFLDFLRTDTTIAFLTALLIFIVTIFLVVKRWIGFGMTFLFLLFSIGSGLAVSSYQSIRYYLESSHSSASMQEQETLVNQLQQAIGELKIEIQLEKENLHRITNQVQEVLDQVDYQRQKLHSFIEEGHSQVKENQASSSSNNLLEAP